MQIFRPRKKKKNFSTALAFSSTDLQLIPMIFYRNRESFLYLIPPTSTVIKPFPGHTTTKNIKTTLPRLLCNFLGLFKFWSRERD